MAMRVRSVQSKLIAICAARSIEKDGDIYIDDGWHYALAQDFDRRHPEYMDNGYEAFHDIEAVAWLNRQTPLDAHVAAAVEVKLIVDRNQSWGFQHHVDEHLSALMGIEESNNENRTWWDKEYGLDA